MKTVLLWLTAACLPTSAAMAQSSSPAAAYDFDHPTATYSLPEALQEISGIALLSDQRIGCIEDQTGTLYIYNLGSKKLESTLKFGKKDDYEDVARVKNAWLILRSDGTLLKHTDQGTTTTFDTGLTAANDPEGLSYDSRTGALLVACKGAAGLGQPDQKRAIYRLDASTYQAEPKPAYLLDVAELIALDKRQDEGNTINRFAPSAIAVHPLTRHIFVLAASGNALVELDGQGSLLKVQKLPRKLFPQPEGLAFAPNGDLYIASEIGDNGKAGMIQFFRSSPIAANK
ncbi:SdiA-regulated domain-containing protein [Hymenobacter metallicola]|uniref:SMP-30/Gluconolactonase/LRE-like region domain-containing protein n=1 Tax=Hymenobacter metallicola TaxID=2563114 RepID=A0A4Z0Q1T2_9BACT|nr:SdiA-regulated domain-containing protein [Hymenobacter metallicola]TGE23476.1 hypothetical protein E5K02_20005 [Hymenobacter metallicola]